jgi:hypothetical protein
MKCLKPLELLAMSRWYTLQLLTTFAVLVGASPLRAEDSSAIRRRQRAQEFHLRAQERTGLLVPMYVYPADIHTNPVYNRLMDLKRRHESVPVWVILNPASGPGEKVDANYTKAIDRLRGAGCVVLGYVSTSYGKRRQNDVRRDIDQWLKTYPRIQGIFFDEMIYENTEAGVKYQTALKQYAHDAGCWPTVGNPGADTPGRYFAEEAADVIVVHEGAAWPAEKQLKGDYFGGYSDYPPFTRAVLLHSQPKLDVDSLRMARKYVRWVYVTEAVYRQGDPRASNPWGKLSKHLEKTCELLGEK